VLPLVIAKGPGAEMDQALGTAVFAGMIGVTFFGIFLTPVFFSLIMKIFARVPKKKQRSSNERRALKENPVRWAAGMRSTTIQSLIHMIVRLPSAVRCGKQPLQSNRFMRWKAVCYSESALILSSWIHVVTSDSDVIVLRLSSIYFTYLRS
jgi:AcrB/AcrD/AcrF family